MISKYIAALIDELFQSGIMAHIVSRDDFVRLVGNFERIYLTGYLADVLKLDHIQSWKGKEVYIYRIPYQDADLNVYLEIKTLDMPPIQAKIL